MATRIQLRRDTAAKWTANNPTLATGEAGYETDTNKLKIGNGSLAWNSLSYVKVSQDLDTTSSPTFAGATIDAIRVGVTGSNEIDTASGNLTIDSAGGTVTVDDNLVVSGNLTVSGTTTTVNTEEINLADNIIVLNANATGSPTENAGIEVERGDSTNVVLRWNESADTWEATRNGIDYYALVLAGDDIVTSDITNFTEDVQDVVGGMVSSNTESGIAVTYDDINGKLNFDVSDPTLTFTGDATGSGTITNLGNTSIELTVVNNSHDHTASNISDFTESVQDVVGGMVSTNTESGISVTYDDANGKLDFDVNDPTITLSGDLTGSGTITNLGNVTITATVVDDSHNHVISNVDGLQAALDDKAPLASPTLSGTPTAPTAASGTNTTQIATTAFVQSATAALVDSAPATLDTLNELAAALGDDPNFATTVSTALGNKQPLDADLTAIAALTGTSGFLKKTAADTWSLDTNTYLTGNQTITLTGDVSGSGTTSISVTVADDSHNHIISNVDGLQTALDSKAPLASPTFTGTTTVPTLTLTTADTATTASHYFVETASDGVVRPKTLANVRTEIVTNAAVNSAAATTVGTVTSGTWAATDVALAHGGTNASLTAVNGGVVYSTASAMAITSAGSAGQVLTSNGSSAPTWQTPSSGGLDAFLLAGM